ncbi:hypothetical protein [Fodinicola feengrottensis]|uniref:hypothetical protein n=1 Tax=Fodinicola feengrottensis TaxID=435914 RepID=UPI0013D4E00F|nr:hypothetical protein [Fodinicola feengrottensis]
MTIATMLAAASSGPAVADLVAGPATADVSRGAIDGILATVGWLSENAACIALLLIGAVVASEVARLVARRRRETGQRDGAHQMILRPPPEVDVDAADAFWRHLRGLNVPAWRRWLYGQPHVAWEFTWVGRELTLSVWVPAGVPPTLIADAATAAWPGTTTRIARVTSATLPPLPAGAPHEGGRLVLATGGQLPLASEHTTDPLRPLLAACGDGKDSDVSVVQVLARPLPSTTGVRQSARHGIGRTLLMGLLDLIDPTVRRTRTPSTARSPVAARQQSAAAEKMIAPSWEVTVQYGVAVTTAPGGRAPKDPYPRLRGRAHAIATSFALYSGHNWFKRRRDTNIATHPHAAAAARRQRVVDY